MKSLPRLLLLTALLLPAPLMATPPSAPVPASDTTVGADLPPKLRGLLIQEMNAILDASKTILDAIVRGQDQVVADKAQAIHDSFIMKQAMTADDKKALLAAAPKSFLKRDRAFHALSANLADAARKGDGAKQLSLYRDLLSACIDCHAHHAQDRFPALNQ